MKKILVCMFLFSVSALAREPVKTLSCGLSFVDFVSFRAKLDPNLFDAGSGLYAVFQANVGYQYSGARLICVGSRPDELGCIGYWNEARGDIAEVRTSKDENGKISATFRTSKAYGERKLTLACEID